MLRKLPSIINHKANLEVTMGRLSGTVRPAAQQATATNDAATTGTISTGRGGRDGTLASDVFETGAQRPPARYAQTPPDTPPSKTHRLQSASTTGHPDGSSAGGVERALVGPLGSHRADFGSPPSAEQNIGLETLFRAVIELTNSQRIPEGSRHRLEPSIFDATSRRLTREIHQSGPQAQMTTAAAERAPQVAGKMLAADLEGSGIPTQERAQIIEYQTEFVRQRALDTPEGRDDLKYMVERRLGQKLGEEAVRGIQGQYEVLSSSTSFDTDLRPSGTGMQKIRTEEAGDIKNVFRPMTKPESPGTCFGRTSHFINHVSDGLRLGQDIRSCVQNGSKDSASVVPGALKQKIYHLAHDKQKAALDETNQYRQDTIRSVDQSHNRGEIDEDTATREVEEIERDFIETRTSLYKELFGPLDLNLQSCAVDTSDDPARHDSVDQALSTGGLNAIIGNMHAVAHVKHEDTHYIFDPLCGTYATDSDNLAKELLLMSLDTGNRSPIGSYHFGQTPTPT